MRVFHDGTSACGLLCVVCPTCVFAIIYLCYAKYLLTTGVCSAITPGASLDCCELGAV